MKINPFKNILNIIGFIFSIAGLIFLPGGCRLFDHSETTIVFSTYIMDAVVDPPSGSSSFKLTVSYAYANRKEGRPANIACSFTRPDGSTKFIGAIYPSSDVVGQALSETRKIENEETLSFDVTKPDGTVLVGDYIADCSTEVMYQIKVPFTVISKEAAPVPANAETETPPVATEVVETPPALPVLNFQAEVVFHGDGYDDTIKWGGDLKIDPDGSVRTKFPGTFYGVIPMKVNGDNISGWYTSSGSFNVDVAGYAEPAENGVNLRIQQTYADYKVDPVTVASGSLSPESLKSCEEALKEAVPKWLDQILRELEFSGVSLPATQDISVGNWEGTATLSLK